VQTFCDSYEQLLNCIDSKAGSLAASA
jgi:hypothetical protein